MGMFDEVNYTCPQCGGVTNDQTKLADRPCLDIYHVQAASNDLPAELAKALAEEQEKDPIQCEHCGTQFRLQRVDVPSYVLLPVPGSGR